MGRLSFQIKKVWPDLHGFTGILLVGPVVDEGDLEVGDPIEVPTLDGPVVGACSGFPLIRLDPDQTDWVRVTVGGVEASAVQIGELALGPDPTG